MPRKTKGFVLYVVLVYLQLFGLLIMASLSERGRLQKHFNTHLTRFTQRSEALNVLKQLEHMNHATCIKPMLSSAYLLHQPFRFWQTYACHEESSKGVYYYFQHDLGIDHCSRMNKGEGWGRSVRYYQLTLVYVEASVIVQETLAMPTHLPPDCHGSVSDVSPGRQRLRWLR